MKAVKNRSYLTVYLLPPFACLLLLPACAVGPVYEPPDTVATGASGYRAGVAAAGNGRGQGEEPEDPEDPAAAMTGKWISLEPAPLPTAAGSS